MEEATRLDHYATAYLERLGLDREPPSVEALARLHRAHVERIPYETLWIPLGEAWTVDPNESQRRIATEQRGGYCFHLNGSLHRLLTALGYHTVRHIGTVHGPEGPTPDGHANHLALTVHNLASQNDRLNGSNWYVDVGLGDALYEPIPLCVGPHIQGPMHLTMTDLGSSRWRLGHDPQLGSFTAMTFNTEPTEMASFANRHSELSTSLHSRFVRTVTVQRRDATGADILRGLILKRVGDQPTSTELFTADEWFTALRDVFDLPLQHLDRDARSRLWNRVNDAHNRWQTPDNNGSISRE
jgi:N-hydroxyarylamine O-acetyltransferase